MAFTLCYKDLDNAKPYIYPNRFSVMTNKNTAPTNRRFAMSDIHGCCRTFRSMVEQTLQLTTNDTLYLLGDYIDRGPDSKGVIDYIWELKSRGFFVVCLRGNHEQMMLAARFNRMNNGLWENNGGDATLLSFGVRQARGIADEYANFFSEMDYYIELDDYVLVHAGFALHESQPLENEQAMMWVRPPDWYKRLALMRPFGEKIVVHGHTPQYEADIIESLTCKKIPAINIDAACAYKGSLCALDLNRCQVLFHPNIDML